MTPEQKEVFETHLKENYGEIKCDGCGSRRWMIKEDFYMMTSVDPETLNLRMEIDSDKKRAEGLLSAVMVCSQCKRVVQISITDMPEIIPDTGDEEVEATEEETD